WIEKPYVARGGERKREADSDHGSERLQNELPAVAPHCLPQCGAVDSQQQHRCERDDAVEFADPVTPEAGPGLVAIQLPGAHQNPDIASSGNTARRGDDAGEPRSVLRCGDGSLESAPAQAPG